MKFLLKGSQYYLLALTLTGFSFCEQDNNKQAKDPTRGSNALVKGRGEYPTSYIGELKKEKKVIQSTEITEDQVKKSIEEAEKAIKELGQADIIRPSTGLTITGNHISFKDSELKEKIKKKLGELRKSLNELKESELNSNRIEELQKVQNSAEAIIEVIRSKHVVISREGNNLVISSKDSNRRILIKDPVIIDNDSGDSGETRMPSAQDFRNAMELLANPRYRAVIFGHNNIIKGLKRDEVLASGKNNIIIE